jgi:hypothetical protein
MAILEAKVVGELIVAATEVRSLSHREKVGVRGYGLTIELNPSPGAVP